MTNIVNRAYPDSGTAVNPTAWFNVTSEILNNDYEEESRIQSYDQTSSVVKVGTFYPEGTEITIDKPLVYLEAQYKVDEEYVGDKIEFYAKIDEIKIKEDPDDVEYKYIIGPIWIWLNKVSGEIQVEKES